MSFLLLKKRNELVIFILISFAANKIVRNIVYTAIKVNTWIKKTHKMNNNLQWSYCFFLIVDKINMIDLKLLI